MTANEKRLIAAAKVLVDRWVHAKYTLGMMQDVESHPIRNVTQLVGLTCSRYDYSDAATRALAAELELIHAVDDCEREARRAAEAAESGVAI